MRWLYLDTYTLPDPKAGAPWSDAIGYGLTSSPAIRRELGRRGIEVVVPDVPPVPVERGNGYRRAKWISEMYGRAAEDIHALKPDLIFAFHIFVTFPAVIRKAVQDLGVSIPIVGYTHGSHWDPTDVYRSELYSGLELLDLANMCVLDRLLLVSEYMRNTLGANIAQFNPGTAKEIQSRISVVGLPIDEELIDRHRTSERFGKTTIVFNHAPGTGKNPAAFARVAAKIMAEYDVCVLFTRDFGPGSPGEPEIAELRRRFGERVMLGGDLPMADYYRALWMSDIQVSTASHESLGIATLEAMRTGNCCVLPQLGSYPEICDGRAEVLYPPGEEGLADRLAYVIEHPAERREIAGYLAGLTARYAPAPVVDRILDSVASLR